MFKATLKRAKSGQNTFDVNVPPLHQATHKRRNRCLQPDWVDLLDPQAFAAGSEQKICVATISATDRFHSGAPPPGGAQQTQDLDRRVRFAHSGVCPGDEKAHATCFARSPVVRFALIACTIDRKIFAPSILPSRASEAGPGGGV